MSVLSNDKLIRLLRTDVIPRVESKERSRFFVAQAKAHELKVPEDVMITRRKLSGKREIMKSKRSYDNQRLYIARRPKDNLQELACPKMAYIIEGIADYLLVDYCARCPPGTFFLILPGVPHQELAPFLTKGHQKDGYCVLLHAYAYKNGVQFWYSYSKNDRHFSLPENSYFIYSLSAAQTLHFAVKEAVENTSHLDVVVRSFTAALFAIIAREIEAGNYIPPGPGKGVPAPSRTESFSEEIRQYMAANCHKELRLEEVAVDLFMSRSQLADRLRGEMNTTFVELLTQYRIERACLALRETNRTFTAITKTLGFRSLSHFHSLFRSRMGCTPMEYRQKYPPKTIR